MAAQRKKKGFSTYILPVLFCGLLIVLAVVKGRQAEQPVKAVLQEGEPLTLTGQAVENYLFSAGFSLEGEAVLDEGGNQVAALTLNKAEGGDVEALTLSFPLPAYFPVDDPNEAHAALKAKHDDGARRGEELFLSLFDAIAATDARADARRDSALEKLKKTMDTGKAAAQTAGSWRFSFSLTPNEFDGTVTILFEKVK